MRARGPIRYARRMTTTTLFLLRPDFDDAAFGPGIFYCPHCIALEGLLATYPRLRHEIAVRYVDFPRPRPAVIAEIGEANQSCPVLVLGANEASRPDLPASARRAENGRVFFVGEKDIGSYFAVRFGIARSH